MLEEVVLGQHSWGVHEMVMNVQQQHRCLLAPSAGDHVGLYARNNQDVVAAAAKCLGLPLEAMFSLHTDGEGARLVTGAALRRTGV